MRALALLLACFLLACAGAGRAATFEAMDFDRLAHEADHIFIGTVDHAHSFALRPRHIVTDYRFVDLELVKGEPLGPSTTVRMLGGTAGELALVIPGAPTFRLGNRYLVFIAGNRRVIFPTLGGGQGIFQVRENAATGQSEIYDYGGRPVSAPPALEPLDARPKSLALVPAMTKEMFVGEILLRLGRRP